MEDKEIVNIIENAIKKLEGEERPLQLGASERSFAHRLAVYIESPFSGWDVDCEYNRYESLYKELDGIESCSQEKKTNRVFPDIVVHHREISGMNLLVIELKNDNQESLCDKKKLELFTNPTGEYRYQLGLYINIGKKREFSRTWYKNGNKISEEELKEI